LIVEHIQNELRINALLQRDFQRRSCDFCCVRSEKHRSATSIDSNNYRAINSETERNVIVSDA